MVSLPEDPQERRRKITAHALQVLRETRAKIDPALLNHMKERLSAVAGFPPEEAAAKDGGKPGPSSHLSSPPSSQEALAPVDAQSKRKPPTQASRSADPVSTTPKTDVIQGLTRRGGLFANAKKDTAVLDEKTVAAAAPPNADDGMEPVDRQKISRIVMKYMQLREDGKAKH